MIHKRIIIKSNNTKDGNNSENNVNFELEQNEFRDKLLSGLALSYQRLLEFKKLKKSPLVIMKDGKITYVIIE
jgi:hypothetical protein